MLQLTDPMSYITIAVLALCCGAIGGFIAELLLNRGGETGMFELPRMSGKHHYDFGGFATMAVGAVAGAAMLLVFPQAEVVVTTSDGSTSVTYGYDALRLGITALVAGSAGGSVLRAFQTRLSAAIAQADLLRTQEVAEGQLDEVKSDADDLITQLQEAGPDSIGGPPPAAVIDAIRALSERAELGKQAVHIAATRSEGEPTAST
jgi:hypothetical protein